MPPYATQVNTRNYGPTASRFEPSRWISSSASSGGVDTTTTPATPTHGPAKNSSLKQDVLTLDSSSSGGAKLPEILSFSVGPRDCVGQNLARVEMQVLLAELVGHFLLQPGTKLEKKLGAAGKGANAADVLKEGAKHHVTMQPEDGEMWLKFSPRQPSLA